MVKMHGNRTRVGHFKLTQFHVAQQFADNNVAAEPGFTPAAVPQFRFAQLFTLRRQAHTPFPI